jgi:hypothetical protein
MGDHMVTLNFFRRSGDAFQRLVGFFATVESFIAAIALLFLSGCWPGSSVGR